MDAIYEKIPGIQGNKKHTFYYDEIKFIKPTDMLERHEELKKSNHNVVGRRYFKVYEFQPHAKNDQLVYAIAHYFDRDTDYANITNHFRCFEQLQIQKKTFVLISAIDDMNHSEATKQRLTQYINKLGHTASFKVIIYYNWGGTIAALWELYKNIKGSCVKTKVALFEEDFYPITTLWYPAAIDKLTDDTIYVGESNANRIKYADDDGAVKGAIHKSPRLSEYEVWTDGGFYFTDLGRLQTMEEKIGVFHKGDQHKKYDHTVDGIRHGEVGFPNSLYLQNLKFDFLNRTDYFKHE